MPPTVLAELELERHGYKVYPQHPYFVAYPDGRYLMMVRRPRAPARGDREVLPHGRRARWSVGRLARPLGEVLGPMLTTVPPKVGCDRRAI